MNEELTTSNDKKSHIIGKRIKIHSTKGRKRDGRKEKKGNLVIMFILVTGYAVGG